MNPGVEAGPLAAWMDGQGLGEGPIEGVEPLGGGTQNIVVGFTRAGRRYVLRRPSVHARVRADETILREALVLDALRSTDVPHPRLLATCSDPAVLGAAFYLMEPVEGFNPHLGLPAGPQREPDFQHSFGLALVDGLLALRRVEIDALGLQGLGRGDDWPGRQVSRWSDRVDRYAATPGYRPPGDGELERLAGWLRARQPAPASPGLVHGDYQPANVMVRFDRPELAAIVDWELAAVGDPLLDLGHLLVCWPASDGAGLFRPESFPGLPSADELIAYYLDAVPEAAERLDWFYVLAGLRLAVVLDESYARSLEGKAPPELGADFRRFAERLLILAHDRTRR